MEPKSEMQTAVHVHNITIPICCPYCLICLFLFNGLFFNVFVFSPYVCGAVDVVCCIVSPCASPCK